MINGVPCHHLFFLQPPGIELELWVAKGEQAVPRRLIVTYRSLPGEPRFIAEMSDWNFNVHPTAADFTLQLPKGATKIDLQQEKTTMKLSWLGMAVAVAPLLASPHAFGWGTVHGAYGGAAYRGPMGAAAVRGPNGGTAVRGPYGGASLSRPGWCYRIPPASLRVWRRLLSSSGRVSGRRRSGWICRRRGDRSCRRRSRGVPLPYPYPYYPPPYYQPPPAVVVVP